MQVPRFQFRLRTLMIVVMLLAVSCWAILSRVRLIDELDDARREADYQRRLAEGFQKVISEPETSGDTSQHSNATINGVVPDARTAIRIALAVWGPIYGNHKIADEMPYIARLNNGVWTVEGSLPEGWRGGTAYIEINRADGKVLKVTHYK
jgi:hypothetical protein